MGSEHMRGWSWGLWWARQPAPGSTGEDPGRDSKQVGFALTLPASLAGHGYSVGWGSWLLIAWWAQGGASAWLPGWAESPLLMASEITGYKQVSQPAPCHRPAHTPLEPWQYKPWGLPGPGDTKGPGTGECRM